MDGKKKGVDYAPHGVKVGLGCLVSIALYKAALSDGAKELSVVETQIQALPEVEQLQEIYKKIGLPTRFSQIGVGRVLLEETIENANTVRERYTILRYLHDKNLLRSYARKIGEILC